VSTIGIIIAGIVLISLAEEGRRVFAAWLGARALLKQQEHQTRRIEALALMDEPARNRLLERMPDWLDRDDPDDVEAWKKARAETLKITEIPR
jgi:hypothetical protein